MATTRWLVIILAALGSQLIAGNALSTSVLYLMYIWPNMHAACVYRHCIIVLMYTVSDNVCSIRVKCLFYGMK